MRKGRKFQEFKVPGVETPVEETESRSLAVAGVEKIGRAGVGVGW